MSGHTITSLLQTQAEAHGDRVLVRDDVRALTFVGALDAAARTAGALAELSVSRGDRVALISENRLEAVELLLGCAWLGAVLVPVNTALRGSQLEHVLVDSGARLVYLEPELADAVDEALPDVAARRLLAHDPLDGEPVAPCALGPGDLATILYTSGTTGPSKGVLCPHAQWYWWARRTGGVLGVREGDVLYTNLPFFHTNAINSFVQALLNGATFHLGPRFSASRFWQRLVDAEATVTYLLGAMIHILSKRQVEPIEREHRVRIALAPATPASLHASFTERTGIRLVDAWGSTETNCVIAADDPAAPPGSLGRVVDGFVARVVDENDEEVPPGVPGELVVRSNDSFAFASGYHGLPHATVETWRNLWFHTGDRVIRDLDGWFWFVDRLRDSIRRRGENISSYEVEAALAAHPDVATSAVVPVPSELGEDEVLAFVVPRPGADLDPAALTEFCRPRLAYFAIPRYVEIVKELPLTSNGKVEKYRLRERGLGPKTWDRERSEVRSVR